MQCGMLDGIRLIRGQKVKQRVVTHKSVSYHKLTVDHQRKLVVWLKAST